MFNLFSSLKGNGEKNDNFYDGETVSLHQLVEKIRQPNRLVDTARSFGKGTDAYETVKEKHLPCFFPNGYNKENTRSTKVYFRSTGYIYLDFDGFTTVEEAVAFKSGLTSHNFIAASWLSTSGKGLTALVKINPEKCNKYQFLKYWDLLNELFNNKLDKHTRNFYQPCIVSSDPDIYVNTNAVDINTLYTVDYVSGLNYSTPVPMEKFESVDKPVVYPNGLDTLKIDLYKFRMYKISEGKRNSTLGALSMQLIHLNPDAPDQQIINAIHSINKNYCQQPMKDDAVRNLVNANLQKKQTLDVSKYIKKRYVFFHPECRIPAPIRTRLRAEAMRTISRDIISNAVDNLISLVKPKKITVNQIEEHTGLKKSTIYKNINSTMKFKMNTYNNNQKGDTKNDTFSIEGILIKDNMHGMEKVPADDVTFLKDHTPTHYKIYEALEDLQDNVDKISQRRIAEYTGLSTRTIKRHWIESFKDLVKDYNNSLKPSKRKQIRNTGDPITTITRAIVALQDTHITKESIVEYTGMTMEELEQYWTDGIQELVNSVNSNSSKSGIVHSEPEEEHNVAGYRNILNPLTDEKKFDEFVEDLKQSKLYHTVPPCTIFV